MLIEIKVLKGSKHVTIDHKKISYITDDGEGTAEIKAYVVGEREYVVLPITSEEAERIVKTVRQYEKSKLPQDNAISFAELLQMQMEEET